MSRQSVNAEYYAVQETIKFFENLLRAAADGIVITDLSQNIVVANKTFCDYLNQSWRNVIETKLMVWLEQMDGEASETWADLERTVRREGHCHGVEFQISSLGNIRYLSVNASLLEQAAYEESGAIVSMWRDITREKQQNEELKHQKAELERVNMELEAFSYSVAHDLRAPLRAITGFGELLKQRSYEAADEKSRHYMDVMIESGMQMGILIDDLLSFSRMGRAEMMKMKVNLNMLVNDAVKELEAETAGRDIFWEIKQLPEVEGDQAMLRTAVCNLISNALKFTRLTLQPRIEVGSYDEKDEAVFYVKDNGAGFDMKYADKLFGIFQRLHRPDEFPGTGIGLANVRRIINRHGGKTWAEGNKGVGATFYFSLPKRRYDL